MGTAGEARGERSRDRSFCSVLGVTEGETGQLAVARSKEAGVREMEGRGDTSNI